MKEKKEWFESWFDSEYYPILYSNRNDDEATQFILNLTSHLHLPAEAEILDLACGRGRHSIILAQKGYNVTGIDISKNSIEEAGKSAGNNLRFYVHDMRIPFAKEKFDAVFNLFTSFGYFDDPAEDVKTLEAVFHSLKRGGIFIFDFLNEKYVRNTLIRHEIITRSDVTFHISRKTDAGCIEKKIECRSLNDTRVFAEKVRLYSSEEIKKMLNATGLQINTIFGNYSLEAFDAENSPRLIVSAQKPL